MDNLKYGLGFGFAWITSGLMQHTLADRQGILVFSLITLGCGLGMLWYLFRVAWSGVRAAFGGRKSK